MMKKKTFFALAAMSVAIFILTGSLLISCAQPTATGTSAATSSGPKYGGTLHVVFAAPPQTLDPVLQTGVQSSALAKLYADTLVTFGGKNAESVVIKPNLAKSWEITPDGLVYTFHLREGMKWHNIPPVNGRAFTAEDVKFAITRILDPKTRSPLRSYLSSMDRVEAPDPLTVKIFLKAPDLTTLQNLNAGNLGMFPREVIEADGHANKTVIGVGPFIYDKEAEMVGTRYSLKRNPDYWDKGKPYLDRVEFTVMPEDAPQIAAFRAGQLDQLNLMKTSLDAVKKTVPDVKVNYPVDLNGVCLLPNLRLKDKPWADVRVRQAMMYAIDYDGLIMAQLEGAGSRIGWLAPYFKEWGAPQVASLPKQDIAKAKALMAEAGYAKGFKAKMIQHTARMDAWGGATEPVAAMLKVIGIETEIVPMEHTAYVAATREDTWDLTTYAAAIVPPLDPDNAFLQTYASDGAYNRSGYANPRLDELIKLQKNNYMDTELRKKYIAEIFSILDRDLPMIPLYYQWKFHSVQPWIYGWEEAADLVGAVRGVWIDKK